MATLLPADGRPRRSAPRTAARARSTPGRPRRLAALGRHPATAPAAVGTLALLAYLGTLSPGVLGGDAGEMQFVPHILSLAHPTGYPLQTLLGRLWTLLLPVGSVAWRMNAFSAVAGAAGTALTCRVVTLLTDSRWAGLGAGALLATSEVYWGQAVSADKYALGALLVVALLCALVTWLHRSTRHSLYLLALVTGLGLAHHRSSLVFVPLVGAYVFWRHRAEALSPRDLVCGAACFCAPLLLYAWLPVGAARGLPPGTWQPRGLSGWIGYLADTGYVEQIRPFSDLAVKLGVYARWLVDQFGLVGVALGLVGIAAQARRREPALPFLAAAYSGLVVLAAAYEVPRHWVFFLPSFVFWAVWLGEGLAQLGHLAGRLTAVRPTVSAAMRQGVTLGVTLLCLAIVAPGNYRTHRAASLNGGTLDLWRQNLKAGFQAERFALLALSLVEEGAIIVADWEQATPLWYYQQVEGLRPDVDIRYPIDRWEEALQTGRPTYVTRNVPGIGHDLHLSTTGPLARIGLRTAVDPPPDAIPAQYLWQEGLELVGYRTHALDTPATDRVIPVSLYFRLGAATESEYSFSLRLLLPTGEQVWAEDRSALALGMYPTSRWAVGEVVGDYWEVPLPTGASSGDYRLALIVYSSAPDGGWHNLTLTGTGEEVAILFSLPPP